MTLKRDVYQLAEADFLDALYTELKTTGNLADVFRQMVTYNVPLFVLGKFAPAVRQAWFSDQTELSFCIAEDGWRGRTSNIKSTYKEWATGYKIDYSKSYCMLSEDPPTKMLVFCLAENDSDQFAIAPVLADPNKQTWQTRDEVSGLFKKSNGTKYDHYRVTGSHDIEKANLIQLERMKYKPLGLEIPKREVTSLSVLAIAQCEHAGKNPPNNIAEAVATIKTSRQEGKIDRATLNAAAKCLDYFKEQNLDGVHALWQKLDIFSRILPKPKPA